MIEFIDKTDETNGTPLNRANMMAIQGFQNKIITFHTNGNITEQTPDGSEMYIIEFNSDGSIHEVFSGKSHIDKTTIFNLDGSITEVLS